jgi:hypothetical protein
VKFDNTINNQKQSRNLLQTDYVLPFGKTVSLKQDIVVISQLLTDYSVVNDGKIQNFTHYNI